jgi:hypothetical protein
LTFTPSYSPRRTQSVTVTLPPPRLPPCARLFLLCLAGCSGAPFFPMIYLCCLCTCSRTTSPFRAARYLITAPDGQGALLVSKTFIRVPFGLHHPVSHLQSVTTGPRVLDSSTDVSLTLGHADRRLKVHSPPTPTLSLPCAIGFMLVLTLLLSCYGCIFSTPTPCPHNQVSSSDDYLGAHRRGTAAQLSEPLIMRDTTESLGAGAACRYSQSSQSRPVHPGSDQSSPSSRRARLLHLAANRKQRLARFDDLSSNTATPQAAATRRLAEPHIPTVPLAWTSHKGHTSAPPLPPLVPFMVITPVDPPRVPDSNTKPPPRHLKQHRGCPPTPSSSDNGDSETDSDYECAQCTAKYATSNTACPVCTAVHPDYVSAPRVPRTTTRPRRRALHAITPTPA